MWILNPRLYIFSKYKFIDFSVIISKNINCYQWCSTRSWKMLSTICGNQGDTRYVIAARCNRFVRILDLVIAFVQLVPQFPRYLFVPSRLEKHPKSESMSAGAPKADLHETRALLVLESHCHWYSVSHSRRNIRFLLPSIIRILKFTGIFKYQRISKSISYRSIHFLVWR